VRVKCGDAWRGDTRSGRASPGMARRGMARQGAIVRANRSSDGLIRLGPEGLGWARQYVARPGKVWIFTFERFEYVFRDQFYYSRR
jgi:hypothetical protein